MTSLKDFVVLGICLTVLPRVASQNFCPTGAVYHSSYKEGSILCCTIKICQAGYEAVLCSRHNSSSTKCQPCPPNTFRSHPTSSVDMLYCEAKQSCGAGMKVEDDNSSVKDRRCLCDLEKGFCNPSRNRSTYCVRRSCPAGKELDQDCGCVDCPDGFFKDVNGSLPCRPWKNCRDENRRRTAKGSTITDAICSNITYIREGSASPPVTKPSTTPVFPENNSTSGVLTVHSVISQHNSSDPNHTTVQTETSQSWIFIVVTVIGLVIISALIILLCLKPKLVKRICACYKSDKPAPAPHHHNPEEVKAPFIGQLSNDQTDDGLQVQEIQPLTVDDDDPCAEQLQKTGCNDTVIDIVPPVLPAPESVEDPYSEMTPAMKESLRSNQVLLSGSLIIDSSFLAALGTNGTITDDMKERIQAERTTGSMNGKFLSILKKRPRMSYNTFIFALVHTGQSNLAKQINIELSTEYQEYIECGGNADKKVLSFGRL